jgi:hypothetical protein
VWRGARARGPDDRSEASVRSETMRRRALRPRLAICSVRACCSGRCKATSARRQERSGRWARLVAPDPRGPRRRARMNLINATKSFTV